MQPERRYLSIDDDADSGSLFVEERDGDTPTINGIAPPWDSLSVDLGGFRERFSATSFDKVLSKRKLDVPLLFNHDDSKPLARTTNGTLRISKSDKGLAFQADPVATPTAAEVMTLIRSKTIFGSSFAFTVSPKGESWEEDERGNVTRTISEAAGLFDISPVTRAAYPSSTVGLRSLSAWREARGLVQHRSEGRGLVISTTIGPSLLPPVSGGRSWRWLRIAGTVSSVSLDARTPKKTARRSAPRSLTSTWRA